MNTNLIHNALNVVVWGLGLVAVVAVYAGCVSLPNGSLDCAASTTIPSSWLPWIVPIMTASAGLKTVINIVRDGLKGLVKEQPPVK